MIFVTVGTSRCDFSRLIKAVDEIAPEFKEEFVVQIGHTTYRPRNIKKVYTFLSMYEFDKLVFTSKLIISHAGIGTILVALEYNKPIIVIPRLVRYNETTTGHQMEILDILKKLNIKNNVKVILDTSLLEQAIREMLRQSNIHYNHKAKNQLRDLLIQDIKKFILYSCP